MMGYSIPKETFVMVGGELRGNPDRPTYLDVIEIPMGKYADLRVRVALVRSEDYSLYDDYTIKSSEDVYSLMEVIDTEPQETLHVIMLNSRNKVLGVQEVSRGGLATTVVEAKLFFQASHHRRCRKSHHRPQSSLRRA